MLEAAMVEEASIGRTSQNLAVQIESPYCMLDGAVEYLNDNQDLFPAAIQAAAYSTGKDKRRYNGFDG